MHVERVTATAVAAREKNYNPDEVGRAHSPRSRACDLAAERSSPAWLTTCDYFMDMGLLTVPLVEEVWPAWIFPLLLDRAPWDCETTKARARSLLQSQGLPSRKGDWTGAPHSIEAMALIVQLSEESSRARKRTVRIDALEPLVEDHLTALALAARIGVGPFNARSYMYGEDQGEMYLDARMKVCDVIELHGYRAEARRDKRREHVPVECWVHMDYSGPIKLGGGNSIILPDGWMQYCNKLQPMRLYPGRRPYPTYLGFEQARLLTTDDLERKLE